MKYMVFARAAGTAERLQQRLLETFRTAAGDGLSAASVNVVTQPDPEWHAVIELWTESAPIEVASLESEWADCAVRIAAFRVTELPGKEGGPARSWPTSGIKTVVPWIARDDISTAECRRRWDEHMVLANRIHVGVARYARNWIDAPEPGTDSGLPPWRGIATQHFLTELDLRERMFDRPESERVIAEDVARFLTAHVFLTGIEYFRRFNGTAPR